MTRTIDKYGCLRDEHYPNVIFGREDPTRYPNVLKRNVAQYHGHSVWGYMLRCEHCGGEQVATLTSSVAWEDAPGRFATNHRHDS